MSITNLIKYLVLSAILLPVLSSCQPESFSVREGRLSGSGSGAAGSADAAAKLRSAGLELERYALLAQEMIISPESESAVAFAAGMVDLSSVDTGVDGISAAGDVRSVFCDVDGIQISWLDRRDNAGAFVAQGLGRDSGQRIVEGLSQRLSDDHLGVYDGEAIRMISGGARDLPQAANCGNITMDIPVGAPVLVFAGIMPAQEQTDSATRFAYNSQSCADGQIGSILNRVLVETNSEGRRIVSRVDGSNAVSISAGFAGIGLEEAAAQAGVSLPWQTYSSNCTDPANVVEMDLDLGMNTASLVDASAYAGATANSVAQTIADNLNAIACRGVTQNEDGSQSGGDAGSEDDFNTCVSDLIEGNETFRDGRGRLYPDADNKVITVSCGGSAVSGATDSYNGVNGTVSYGAFNGNATYLQPQIRRVIEDEETGEVLEDDTVDAGPPWLDSVNCYRTHTMIINNCEAFAPGGGLVFQGGSGYTFTREETITRVIESDYPGQVEEPQLSSWSVQNADCTWLETAAATDCPSGYELVSAGTQERLHMSTNASGGTLPGPWNVTQAPQCAPICEPSCPTAAEVCDGETYTSSDGCGGACYVLGTNTIGACSPETEPEPTPEPEPEPTPEPEPVCTPDPASWAPAENTVCDGESFTQTNNCGDTRSRTGSKTDGECSTGGGGGGSCGARERIDCTSDSIYSGDRDHSQECDCVACPAGEIGTDWTCVGGLCGYGSCEPEPKVCEERSSGWQDSGQGCTDSGTYFSDCNPANEGASYQRVVVMDAYGPGTCDGETVWCACE